MKKVTNAVWVALILCGAARLIYDEYWLRELILQVRADTAFEEHFAEGCKDQVKPRGPISK